MPPAKSTNEGPAPVAALTSSTTTGTVNPSSRTIKYGRKKTSFDTEPRTVLLQEHKRHGVSLAQLNRQDSDDLVEYEAHLKSHTPTELGKRDRTDSPNKEELNRERPIRRPVRLFSSSCIWPITHWECRGPPIASLTFKPKLLDRRRSAFAICSPWVSNASDAVVKTKAKKRR
jgi:hypothetical protein